MPYQLDPFQSVGLDEAMLELLIHEHQRGRLPRLDTLWRYFRNPLEPTGSAASSDAQLPRYRQAQASGLPERLLARQRDHLGLELDDRRPPREIVIENDIAWRVQTMVDFMFSKPLQILSTAAQEPTRRAIERVLDAVWEASGGIGLLQDIALLGHVFGYVDLALRIDERALLGSGDRLAAALATGSADALADLIQIEPIEPRRGLPLIDPDDYRRLDAFVIHFEREFNRVDDAGHAADPSMAPGASSNGFSPGSLWRRRRLLGPRRDARARPHRATGAFTEILGPGVRQVYEGGELALEETSVLLPEVVPVVHVQNLSQPFRYEGLSEVEPLIALQDELNTRLSDRANRVTLQSFKMYLAKGLDGFADVPVGPGQMWTTDNPDASIQSFGGDSASPSESEHIDQIREAMDKVSSVPPLAGGVVRAKIGNLSSANALRITLLSILSKTARKRVTYGRGVADVCRMVLTAMDAAGVLRTDPADRGVRLIWPDPQPVEPADEVIAAQQKVDLGVPQERVLAELGYAPSDPGIV